MRKNIVAGNWKMNKSLDQGLELVNDINKEELIEDGSNAVKNMLMKNVNSIKKEFKIELTHNQISPNSFIYSK